MSLNRYAKRLLRRTHILQPYRKLQRWIGYVKDYKNFVSLGGRTRFGLRWKDRYPCLNDKTVATPFDAHYVYHPAWAARILAKTRPVLHVDISSSLNFCTIASAFVPIDFYDYRPANLSMDNLRTQHADLLSLPFEDETISSISCMHVIEHVGLGRYGDDLDPDGDLKAVNELLRVLSKGGNLLFVTPVGKPVIRFNAHRIYSFDQIVSYFSELSIHQFSLVDDRGRFFSSANKELANQQNYGCGCWWFVK